MLPITDYSAGGSTILVMALIFTLVLGLAG